MTTRLKNTLLLLPFLLLAANAQAATETVTYIGDTDPHNWYDEGIWDIGPEVVPPWPGITADIVINTAGANITTAGGSISTQTLTIHNGSALRIEGGGLFTSNGMTNIGNNSDTAKLYVGGDAVTSTFNTKGLRIGNNTASTQANPARGEMHILDKAIVNVTTTHFGIGCHTYSEGSLVIDGGTLNINGAATAAQPKVFVGVGANSVGSITVEKGEFNIATLLDLGYGDKSQATLTINGGKVNHINNAFNLGNKSKTAVINVNINGGELNVAGINVGCATGTSATITQTGGTLNATVGTFALANGTDTKATYTISDGKIEAENRIFMSYGQNSTSTLTQTGGEIATGQLHLAAHAGTSAANGSSATLDISGGTFKVTTETANYLRTAYNNGTAAINLSGDGQLISSTDLLHGYGSYAKADLNISGNSSLQTRSAIIGHGGRSNANINLDGNGKFLSENNLILGYASNSKANVTLSGNSRMEVGTDIFLAYGTSGSTGTLKLSDTATLKTGGNLTLGGVTTGGGEAKSSTAILNLAGAANATIGGTLTLGNGTNITSAKLDIADTATLSAGALHLGMGNITLGGGSLSVANEILAVKTTAAHLALNGGALSADALVFDITDKDFAGQLHIDGPVNQLTLSKGIIIDLSNWTGDPAELHLITLVTYTDTSIENFSVTFNYGALEGQIEADYEWDSAHQELHLLGLKAIPEPANIALILALSALGIVFIRRRISGGINKTLIN